MSRAPLVLASELTKRPVVSIDGGDDIAEIKDVVFDPVKHDLVGFTLNKRGTFAGRLKATLPAEEISAIGPDAIMVASEQRLADKGDGPESLASPSDNLTVIGTSVLSADGDVLGTVSDVVIETSDDPQAVGYQVDGANGTVFVPISAQLALSDENLLLPAEATDFVRTDLAGFGAAVADFRRQLDDGTDRPTEGTYR